MANKHNIASFKLHLKSSPHIYNMFEQYALKAIREKKLRFGARTIIEIMRWETPIEDNDSNFKVDHAWCPYYARRFMYKYPEYTGFFRLQNQKGCVYETAEPDDYFLEIELENGVLKNYIESTAEKIEE